MEKSLVLDDAYLKELTIADMKEMERLTKANTLGYDAVAIYLHVGVINAEGKRYFPKLSAVDTITVKQANALQKEIMALNKLEDDEEDK